MNFNRISIIALILWACSHSQMFSQPGVPPLTISVVEDFVYSNGFVLRFQVENGRIYIKSVEVFEDSARKKKITQINQPGTTCNDPFMTIMPLSGGTYFIQGRYHNGTIVPSEEPRPLSYYTDTSNMSKPSALLRITLPSVHMQSWSDYRSQKNSIRLP